LTALGFESPTAELDAEDLDVLDRWAEGHLASPPAPPGVVEPVDPRRASTPPLPVPAPVAAIEVPARAEAGLRVCPRCGRPLHLSAEACRNCGAPVPRR
jgi:hypothetical protein